MIANRQKPFFGVRPSGPRECGGGGSYLIFDVPVSSEIPLPELPTAPAHQAGEFAITVRLGDAGAINCDGFETCHEWRTEQGLLIGRCARRDADYLVSFPQQAEFFLQSGGCIDCVPVRGLEEGVVRHLLLNQVLPRYLAHTGELLLHASAVTLANGKTVAFVGRSGFGKSTLAAYCQLKGAQLVDDDCILLRCTDQGLIVKGGAPTVRLYPDSLQGLALNPAGFSRYADSATKLQSCLPVCEQRDSVSQLSAIFLLGEPEETPPGTPVCITPAGGQAAMMTLLDSAFSLHPSDRDTLSGTFSRVAQVLAAGLPVLHLRYRREYAALPQVLAALQDRLHA